MVEKFFLRATIKSPDIKSEPKSIGISSAISDAIPDNNKKWKCEIWCCIKHDKNSIDTEK